jgi:hypothetical protein
MIPLIADYRDRRARSKSCDRTWLDVSFVALPPTIIAIVTVSGLLTRDRAWLTPLVDTLLPLISVLGVVFVISARAAPDRRDTGFNGAEPQRVYRYCSGARNAAKVALVPMIAVASCVAWASAPNIVRGRDASGYVCNADGTAMRGFVQITDRAGVPLANTELDDRGFFFVRLKALGSAPASIELINSRCANSRLSWHTTQRAMSCPRERVESPQTGSALVWVFVCH